VSYAGVLERGCVLCERAGERMCIMRACWREDVYYAGVLERGCVCARARERTYKCVVEIVRGLERGCICACEREDEYEG
jgi:hypothetical protein